MPKNNGPKKAKRNNKGQQTDPTAYFTQALTKQQAKQQAHLQARLATQAASRELKQEGRAAKLTTSRDQDYFKQYIASIPQAAQQAQAATATAIGQINQTGQTAAQYAEAVRQKLAEEGRADAALRGANYDPSQDSTAAQAALSRLDSSGILANVTAAQGASTQGLYAARGDTALRQKLQQRLDDQARHRTINADKRALAQKKGDVASQAFTDTIGRERDFYLGQQAAQLNAKGQKIDARQTRRQQKLTAQQNRVEDRLRAQSQAETHRHNQASEATSQQNAQTSAQRARLARRQARYDRRHPNAGDKPNENPNKPNNDDVNQALALLRTTSPKWLQGKSESQIVDAIITKDQTISRKEAELAYKRFVRQQRSNLGF